MHEGLVTFMLLHVLTASAGNKRALRSNALPISRDVYAAHYSLTERH